MLLTDLVAPNAIIPALKVNGKKQVLQELAGKAGAAGTWRDGELRYMRALGRDAGRHDDAEQVCGAWRSCDKAE